MTNNDNNTSKGSKAWRITKNILDFLLGVLIWA